MFSTVTFMRIALIGDIGGHASELVAALVVLGADPQTLLLHNDLTVVQVGDLVHRGPESDWVVELVAEQLEAGHGRWIQLIGNHETPYLTESQFRVPPVSGLSEQTIASWYRRGQLHAAAALECGELGAVLVTHAGLTREFWLSMGSPASAVEAAASLNAMAAAGDWEQLLRPGRMLGGGMPDFGAGPVWAEAGWELRESWRLDAAPFSQVHGHSLSVKYGKRGEWLCSEGVAANTVVDRRRRHVTTTLHGRRIVGIDPGLGRYAGVNWEPLVLSGSVQIP